MATILIYADVKFIDFDLSDRFNSRPEMIL